MHLLKSQPGGFVDEEGIIDLEQSPADIVLLSASDSSLAALTYAAETLPSTFPSIRLANWLQLIKPAALDLYRDKVLDHAKVVVVSLLGGKSYWQYGVEQLEEWVKQSPSKQPRYLIVVSGDDSIAPELTALSTLHADLVHQVWGYLREGGLSNSQQLFYLLATHCLNANYAWLPPKALPHCLLYLSDSPYAKASFEEWYQLWPNSDYSNVCLVLFYRSHLQSANIAMFDAFFKVLASEGLQPLLVAITSLKDPESLSLVNHLLERSKARLIINTTGFSSNRIAAPELSAKPTHFLSPFSRQIPVFQIILSSSTQDDWEQHSQGLRSRDIAMQVVLPEMDGRIITRTISFKADHYFSRRCEISVIQYQLHVERAIFVAQLAKRYCQLANKANKDKRIALILANYPTKDGRIGNGVGLDTPESTRHLLHALLSDGYPVMSIPKTGNQLIEALLQSVTNNPNTMHYLPCWQSIAVADYQRHFSMLPIANQQAILQRWGAIEEDPKYRKGRLMISGIRLGETFVGIQPARGFNQDLSANYHDPDLVPPHSYLAFYFWLRYDYQVDAIIHVGKHGNLEWLPGKGIALSKECWPDLILGAMPHFYPFIVNDPGEGAQAKRRTQAVIIDHLMPPMTRAETYGELAELEQWVDEYYQAMGMDKRRETWLRKKILKQAQSSHILEELHTNISDDNAIMDALDTYLCDIKEAQIRHGLHILGRLPKREKLADTIVSLLRLPRGKSLSGQGILHAISHDLRLDFDPLKSEVEQWKHDRPPLLENLMSSAWRTTADTRERLEWLAKQWVNDYVLGEANSDDLKADYPQTYVLLTETKKRLLVALKTSEKEEINALLTGLRGGFVAAGPSGAPTRGRLDVLPTGRNFFSVDSRSIPSRAAWALGCSSAQALIERHLQDHGDYPRQLGLSVWGTATMRTGGDDIAQAFALMGIQPIWAEGSQRVIDFEITSSMLLNRPRVDVTLRVSGFFRDAFPNVMKLYDAAVQALANYDESRQYNTIRAHIEEQTKTLIEQGVNAKKARQEAGYRVFGSKPGAYGAGLQGLIDERCWENTSDLAEAYVNWGGYAYSNQSGDGVEAKVAFQNRLSQLDTVVQNQDNREHDLLDSDDYYQFQGGMSNAISTYKGESPIIYHNDHANPSSPKIRTLKEELNRVIRSRLSNPKWIKAMQEHGYKGAFEMAASVDYLFAYDATTHLIDNYQYENVAEQLIFDAENQRFMQENNPNALEEMSERLLEAIQRNLWQDTNHYKERLQDLLLYLDQGNEVSEE